MDIACRRILPEYYLRTDQTHRAAVPYEREHGYKLVQYSYDRSKKCKGGTNGFRLTLCCIYRAMKRTSRSRFTSGLPTLSVYLLLLNLHVASTKRNALLVMRKKTATIAEHAVVDTTDRNVLFKPGGHNDVHKQATRQCPQFDPEGPVIVFGMGGSGTRSMLKVLRQAGVDMGGAGLLNGKPQDLAEFLPPLNGSKYKHRMKPNQDKILHKANNVMMKRLNISYADSHEAQQGIIERVLRDVHRKQKGTLSWEVDDLDAETQKELITAGLVLKTIVQEFAKESVCAKGRKKWGWKAPRHIFLLPFFKWMFPKAKFIHVLRHPLDFPGHKRGSHRSQPTCGFLGQAHAWLHLAAAVVGEAPHTKKAGTRGGRIKGCGKEAEMNNARIASALWSNVTVEASRWGTRSGPTRYMEARMGEDIVKAPTETALAFLGRLLDFIEVPATDDIVTQMLSQVSSDHVSAYSNWQNQTSDDLDKYYRPWLAKELAKAMHHFDFNVPRHLKAEYDELLTDAGSSAGSALAATAADGTVAAAVARVSKVVVNPTVAPTAAPARGFLATPQPQLLGRESEYFSLTGFGDGVPSPTCSGAWIDVLPEYPNLKFAFSINAGHSGSTTFGALSSYETVPKERKENVCGIFEAGKLYLDRGRCITKTQIKRGVDRLSREDVDAELQIMRDGGRIPLNLLPKEHTRRHRCGLADRTAVTYLSAKNANASSPLCAFASKASNTVADIFGHVGTTPHLRGELEFGKQRASCEHGITNATSFFFDFGHTTLFGLGDAFVRALGAHRVSFIRYRRTRHDNALSYHKEKKIPCTGLGGLVLCPFDHGSVLLAGDPHWPSKWKKLSDYQKCLFLVDEVEARWTAFREQHPTIEALDISWRNGSEVAAGLESTAAFLSKQVPSMGFKVNPVQMSVRHHNRKKSNTRKQYSTTLKQYAKGQRTYLEIMAYSEAQLALIQAQLDFDVDFGQ